MNPTPAQVDPDNPDSAFYWAGLREHRLLMQRCGSCATVRFPPMPGCPTCGSDQTEIIDCSGSGVVYSLVVVHRAVDPASRDEVPYSILTVDLAEGSRVFARLAGPGGAQIGDLVDATYVDHSEWTELRFAIRESR
jgi:uncharacterized OB-fold protein